MYTEYFREEQGTFFEKNHFTLRFFQVAFFTAMFFWYELQPGTDAFSIEMLTIK